MEYCTARFQRVYLCGLSSAKGRLSWDSTRSVSLASGSHPSACTLALVPPLSLFPLRVMFKTPSSIPRLVVERFPIASGTNPQFSAWATGPCVFCPRTLSEPFLTFRGPGCALCRLLLFPTALLVASCLLASSQDISVL